MAALRKFSSFNGKNAALQSLKWPPLIYFGSAGNECDLALAGRANG